MGQLFLFQQPAPPELHPDANLAAGRRMMRHSAIIMLDVPQWMGVPNSERIALLALLEAIQLHEARYGWDLGELYGMENRHNEIKLGFSRNPDRRLRQHETSAGKLDMVFRCPGTTAHEHKLFDILSQYRIDDDHELFRREPAVVYAMMLLGTLEPDKGIGDIWDTLVFDQ